jgi:hypothetical protein
MGLSLIVNSDPSWPIRASTVVEALRPVCESGLATQVPRNGLNGKQPSVDRKPVFDRDTGICKFKAAP